MKNIKLCESMKNDFLEYAIYRRDHNKYYSFKYLTKEILTKTFEYMLKHKLTVAENSKSWVCKNGKQEILCYGYSGPDINCRDDKEGMIENLFHEIWCKAEWIARSKIQSYTLIVKQDIGTINYNYILSL